ncbi:MAG: choice-of-anchor D domain-containing protein [Burkholderiales bacterium]|nr:choice-of-anchor D domain-containing protein [Burkholderiales bacterium]
MLTSTIRVGLRLLAIAILLGIGSVSAAAADYYIRISGSPSTITCTNTGFTFGSGAQLQWGLASASSLVDGSMYINGALIGSQTSSPGALSGTPSGSIDLSLVFTGGAPYASTPFPYTLNYVLQPQEANTDGGSFSFTCTASGGTSFQTTVIPARAAVLSATPSSVGFATTDPGVTSASTDVTITNSGTADAEGVAVSLTNTADFGITANSCGATIPQGASCSLSLVFHPSASGYLSGKVNVDTTTGARLSVSVNGTGYAQLSIVPAVSFGVVNVGTTSTPKIVTVTNSSATPVVVSGVTSGNPAEFPTTTTCATIGPGATCTITISFAPAAAGTRSSTVTVVSDGIGSPQSIAVSGIGSAVAGSGQLSLPASVVFGAQTVGTTSATSSVLVTNIGSAAVTISGIASSAPAEFVVSAPGCTTLAAGASCTIGVTFAPTAAGARSATITVTSSGTGSPQTIAASGVGSAAPTPGRLEIVGAVDAGSVQVGTTGLPNSVAIANTGGMPVTVASVGSSNPGEFTITASNCGRLEPAAACSFSFTFSPAATGTRGAEFTITSDAAGSPQMVLVTGTGTSMPPPPPVTIDVIEYYHAEWDHYFMTGIADEIAKLDAGVFKGWTRTGYQFKAYAPNTAGSANVCRFFSTSFGERSSHFYTPFVGECAKVKVNPDWMLESEQVFAIPIPDADGVCPAETTAVYRYYNDGQGGAPNHRYTIETSLRDDMITVRGWTPEGYGPLGVIMCAPI